MAYPYTSGSILVGSFSATIAAQTYIFDNCNLTLPSKQIMRTDESDEPAALYVYEDFGTFTAVVQVTGTALQQDLRGETFTIPGQQGVGAAKTAVITAQTANVEKSGMKTFNISGTIAPV